MAIYIGRIYSFYKNIYIKRNIGKVIMTETRLITNTKRQGDK